MSPTMPVPLPTPIPICNECPATFQQPLLPTPDRLARLMQISRNWPPCDVEVREIRAMLSSIPKELERYERELEQKDLIMERLIAGRNAILRLQDQCTGIVDAPIRCLPAEILVSIFQLCEQPREWSEELVLPESWDREAKQELRRLAGGHLLPLSQVCSRWRQIAHNTPTLWSHISLDMRFWSPGVLHGLHNPRAIGWHDQMLHLVRRALRRGQQTALTIEVHGAGECDPQALQILAAAAPRWRSANLVLGSEMLHHFVSVAGNLPRLETLAIDVLEEDEAILRDVIQYFSNAPRLRDFQFCGPLSVVAQLPLEQSRCLTYTGLERDDLRALFLDMNRLGRTELHIKVDFAGLGPEPLDLPSIDSAILELDISSEERTGIFTHNALADIFGALTAPTMELLHLRGGQSGEPLFWPAVKGHALLRRSGSCNTLHSLKLHDVIIEEGDLLDCLAEVPLLRYLFLSDHPRLEGVPGSSAHHLVTDSLFKALLPQPELPAQPLVPHLAIVDFKTLGRFSDDAFTTFAVQRTMLTAPGEVFECALLWIPGHVRPRICEQAERALDCLVERGRILLSCRKYDPEDYVTGS
ncbi:hypothetical protein C8R47DRAFT_1268071 [Mycena vitilis]|nr:hypothetical protein C8R47DRAFT_1268071 [Mycena vitilis]